MAKIMHLLVHFRHAVPNQARQHTICAKYSGGTTMSHPAGPGKTCLSRFCTIANGLNFFGNMTKFFKVSKYLRWSGGLFDVNGLLPSVKVMASRVPARLFIVENERAIPTTLSSWFLPVCRNERGGAFSCRRPHPCCWLFYPAGTTVQQQPAKSCQRGDSWHTTCYYP